LANVEAVRVRKEDLSRREEKVSIMSQMGENRFRILIADDEAPVRSLLRNLLAEDYECAEAASAEEALALVRAEKFDLVLSDILMSGISGLEMIPQVRQLSPDTVVVMISGGQNIESAIGALRAGAFDYITKPFDLQHVELAVRRAIEHCALLRAKRRHDEDLEKLVEARTSQLAKANASLRQEIIARRHAEEQANYLAYFDPVTDLPNQKLFKARLTHTVLSAQQEGRKVAAVFLSVDRFKKINDTLGHAAGEQLLRAIAKRLNSRVGEDGALARFEGDEFSLLLTRVAAAEEAVRTAEDIQRILQPPFNVGGQEIYLTTSIGISLYPDDGLDGETLLQNAGAALFDAKRRGGNGYQFYTPEINTTALNHLTLECDLRQAMERGELFLHYQPQVAALSGQIVGMEALVRWQHPERGMVSPADFIQLAEDNGLIVPLGEWVLRTACMQNKRWQAEGYDPLRVAVNISARQFEQPGFIETVARSLEETGLNPSCLELELTESSVMKNPELAHETLSRLRGMGIEISIDDFGTGYSSLSYLNRLPLSKLKIDQSFVRGVITHQSDAAIVRAVITLARSLELKVIAEGVETEDQLALLNLLGCNEMQGYLFSKPIAPEVFEQKYFEGQYKSQREVAVS
jgi:diguanylate cyclase (GGDEF)-like protein